MILTCELCQSQFLTESDPHVVIPGQEIKIYCYCQVKQSEKELNVSKFEYDKDKEAFNKYVEANKSIYFGLSDWEVDIDRTIWEAACNYKQKEIKELKAENKKLREALEFYAAEENQIAPIYKHDGRNCPGADFTAPYRMDSGKRARQCLKELENK